MATIEISEETYQRLLSYASQQGVPASSLDQLADGKLRQLVGGLPTTRRSAEELIASFREFRGSLLGTSLSDIVADRHRGLR